MPTISIGCRPIRRFEKQARPGGADAARARAVLPAGPTGFSQDRSTAGAICSFRFSISSIFLEAPTASPPRSPAVARDADISALTPWVRAVSVTREFAEFIDWAVALRGRKRERRTARGTSRLATCRAGCCADGARRSMRWPSDDCGSGGVTPLDAAGSLSADRARMRSAGRSPEDWRIIELVRAGLPNPLPSLPACGGEVGRGCAAINANLTAVLLDGQDALAMSMQLVDFALAFDIGAIARRHNFGR